MLTNCMAHKLADRERSRAEGGDKGLLNRREYVKAGAAATALVMGTGTGLTAAASEDDTASFATGFSEYVQ